MKKIKLAILFGGNSSEYEISLKSASSIINNLNKDKYKLYLIGINKLGDAYLYEGETSNILNDTWFKDNLPKINFSTNSSQQGFYIIDCNEFVKIDLLWPIMHGHFGEDGHYAALFDLAHIPYVGSGLSSSNICLNKYFAHQIAQINGINIPKTYLFPKNSSYEEVEEKVKLIGLPIFVKPLKEGSSFGISKVDNLANLKDALDVAFKYDEKIVIEEAISGFEVGCAIIGNQNYLIGDVDEVDLKDGFFDYQKKYQNKTKLSKISTRLTSDEKKKIKEVALKLYKTLECQDYARVDLFYQFDGKIIFNEINTIPGFTETSRFPEMFKSIGYTFPEILDEIIKVSLDEKD